MVPSITTALNSVGDPRGLIHWNIEQTALFAVTHLDDLLNRTEEAGVRYLQYATKKQKAEVLDDEELSVFNFARVLLNDLADTGDTIHKYIEDDLNDRFPDFPTRNDHVEMAEAYHAWRDTHEVEVLATEATVFGDEYAGTGDVWAIIDGVPMLIDAKSSRKLGTSHLGQLAALGAADLMAREVPEGTEGAVHHKITPAVSAQHGGRVDSWWLPVVPPAFSAYGVLQVRPGDFHRTTGEYIAPFCELHTIPQEAIDAGWDFFQAGLRARKAEATLKKYLKQRGEEDD